MRWMSYMKQACGTSVEDVHKMMTDVMEGADVAALGTVIMEAVESVSMAQIMGAWGLNKSFFVKLFVLSFFFH